MVNKTDKIPIPNENPIKLFSNVDEKCFKN